MKRTILAVALTLGLFPVSAEAALLFSDNFDTENGGVGLLNYSGFANFQVTDGTFDLLGNGFFFFPYFPENNLYIDLDGSTANAGVLSASALALAAGNYILSFDLAGSQRGSTTGGVELNASELVTINVFGLSTTYATLSVEKLSADPFATGSLSFRLLAADTISFSFANAGGDHVGALLDNVQLNSIATQETAASPVPEPTSLLLMGTGLGFFWRRVRRKSTF